MPAQQPCIAASLSPARMANATLVATMLQRARPKKINDPKAFADVFGSWQMKRNSPRKSSNDDKEFQRVCGTHVFASSHESLWQSLNFFFILSYRQRARFSSTSRSKKTSWLDL